MASEKDLIQKRLLEDFEPSLVNMEILYKHEHQINIEQFKDFQSFENFVERALRNSSSNNYTSIDSKYLKETCLDIGSKNGLTTFVKTLLRQKVQINRVNKMCNRAPIHFATEGGHVDTLEALLDDSTVNPNLQAGQQTALHIAVNKNDQKCALLLLKKGANANIPNNENLTAIYIAAREGQRDMVQLILQEHWLFLDLDKYRDNNNQTIRDLIYQNLSELSLEFYKRRIFIMNGFQYYLIVNDETNFLNMLDKETFWLIEECVELLKTAVQNDLHKAVKAILNWLKRIKKNWRKFVVEQAARVAIKNGRYAILQELLNVVPEVANDVIIYACQQLKTLSNQGIDRRLHIPDWLKCMKLILDQKGVNIHKITDDKSNTPLHYAVKSGYSEVITLFLSQDSYIGHLNKFNIPPIEDIPESVLSNYFDNCIQMKTNENTNERAIEFNYRCLMPCNVSVKLSDGLGTPELGVFMYIANNDNLKELLKHPLLSSFLYLKWCEIQHFLFANFVFYTLYYILLNSYILNMVYGSSLNENEMQMFSGKFLDFSSNVFIPTEMLQQNICSKNILQYCIVLMLVCFIIREGFLIVCCFWQYVKDLTNWLQIVIIALNIVLMVYTWAIQPDHRNTNNNDIYKMYKIYTIGVMMMLLSTWKIMTLIRQYPKYSTSIVIFRTVFCNFVRLFLPYILFIVVFALVFQILFKDNNNSHFKDQNIFFSVKIIIMLTGEFDIDDITLNSKDQFESMFIRFIFVIFVFFMVIVLMNMINGMAISDTAKILSKTKLTELIYQIRLIAYFENIACAIRRWSSKYPQWWRSFANFASLIFLFPHSLNEGKFIFKLQDSSDDFHDDNDIRNNCKMDHDIIKQAKQIIFNKNQQSEIDKLMILNKLEEMRRLQF